MEIKKRSNGLTYLVAEILVEMTTDEQSGLGVPSRHVNGTYVLNLSQTTVVGLMGYYDDEEYNAWVTQIRHVPNGCNEVYIDKVKGDLDDITDKLHMLE